MRIIFAGTPQFAADHLSALCDHLSCEVLAVITQPDKPGKRGKKPIPSPVKALAVERGLPVLQPHRLTAGDLSHFDFDLLIVVAYGQILKPAVLAQPKIAALNVHASSLPRWRGAAPIQRAILAGDTSTGICLMAMDAGLDTGPILAHFPCLIASDETSGSLQAKLSIIGCDALPKAIDSIAAHGIQAKPQPEQGVTYADKIEKTEAKIDWSKAATTICQQILGLSPDPVAYTLIGDQRLRCHHAVVAATEANDAIPGTVLEKTKSGLRVQCGVGQIWITQLQLPTGKGTLVSGADLANARISGLMPGTLFQ